MHRRRAKCSILDLSAWMFTKSGFRSQWAESGRSGTVEYLGEIANEPSAISKLCDRLGRPGKRLSFCYEAGPCGYGVHRQLAGLGHRCEVVAPSLIPKKPGDRVKTNRRGRQHARPSSSGRRIDGHLGAGRRSRGYARFSPTAQRRAIRRDAGAPASSRVLLRHGRKHGRGRAWGLSYRRWLSSLTFEHAAQQIAFQDYVDAVTDAERRLKHAEEQIFQPRKRMESTSGGRRFAGDARHCADQCGGAGR